MFDLFKQLVFRQYIFLLNAAEEGILKTLKFIVVIFRKRSLFVPGSLRVLLLKNITTKLEIRNKNISIPKYIPMFLKPNWFRPMPPRLKCNHVCFHYITWACIGHVNIAWTWDCILYVQPLQVLLFNVRWKPSTGRISIVSRDWRSLQN